MRTKRLAWIALAAAVGVAPAWPHELFVYPQKGQSAERQEKDEFECYKWAKEKTGFDPTRGESAAAARADAREDAVAAAARTGGERRRARRRGRRDRRSDRG
jgi:hypothetical protein